MFDGLPNTAAIADTRDTERVILGEILINSALIRQTARLSTMDFAAPFHRAVFAAMLELDEENRPLDPFLIHEILKREKYDAAVSSITGLTYGLPETANIGEYVSIVQTSAATRSAVLRVESLAHDLANQTITLKAFCVQLSLLESSLRDRSAEQTDSFKPLSEIFQTDVLPTLDAYFKSEVSEFLISTGFAEIDRVLNGGLYRSDFLAIVAPPKSAKSALALQMARRMAAAGETVGLLSLEMSNLQNALRLIAQESFQHSVAENGSLVDALSASWLRPGIYESSYKHASELAANLFLDNFFICQKPLTWKEFQAEARRLVKEKGLTVLLVDYWQLMSNEMRKGSRADELAEIAKGLKRLGQELNIVVIALGQFNQEGLRRREQTGELSTLYLEGSGELVKSANIVLTVDIKAADLKDSSAPREGTLTFRPLRSAADDQLKCLFFGKYLTVEIV